VAEEAVFCAIQLYALLGTAIVRQETGLYSTLKWIPRTLAKVDPDCARSLHEGLKELISSGNIQSYCVACEGALEKLGGPLWEGYMGRTKT